MLFFGSERISAGVFIIFTIILCQCSFIISEEKLPTDLQPVEYILEIYPNIYNTKEVPKFFGLVQINVLCTHETQKIILHKGSLNVEIGDIQVWHVERRSTIEVGEVSSQDELYILELKQRLMKNESYAISLQFSGSLSDNNNSMYVGKNRQLMAYYTLTKEASARHIFPCFDQVDLKAKFTLKLAHKKRVIVFGNSYSIAKTNSKYKGLQKWIVDEFAVLENISTYSINFALTTLPCTKYTPENLPIVIQVCTESDYMKVRESIWELVAQIFLFISSYLQLPYPLPKFDLIIHPGDQPDNPNITEGYGLINAEMEYILSSVFETNGIYVPDNPRIKYEGMSRLCYVMSHQWFGHMVTLNWEENWFHIALNHFVRWRCAEKIHVIPDHTQFPDVDWDIISSFLNVLKREDTGEWIAIKEESSSTVTDPESHILAEQLVAHFVRMIHFFLGPAIFEACVKAYLEKYTFKHTHLTEVWALFTSTALSMNPDIFTDNLDMRQVMLSWIKQNGHPVIIVNRDYETGEVTVTQERFTLFEMTQEAIERNRKKCWTVPLSYVEGRKQMEVKLRTWLTCDNKVTFMADDPDNNQWIMVNVNLNVMSRTHYDEENWIRIKDHFLHGLKDNRLNLPTRIRLVSDMFATAKAGILSYGIVFETMKYLRKEKRYAVWKVAMEEFHDIRNLLLGSTMEFHERFKRYMEDMLTPFFESRLVAGKYKFSTRSSSVRLSMLIMEEACTFGVPSCLNLASQIIEKIKYFPNSSYDNIPLSVHKVIHCQEVKENESHLNRLWTQLVRNDTTEEVRDVILETLGCSRDQTYLMSFLEKSLEKLSIGDTMKIFKGMSTNIRGYEVMKDFFKKYYHKIVEGTEGEKILDQFWKIIFYATTDDGNLTELTAFAKDSGMILRDSTMKKGMMNARRNIMWLENNLETLSLIIP